MYDTIQHRMTIAARVINNCMLAYSVVLMIQGVFVTFTPQILLTDLVICAYAVFMHVIQSKGLHLAAYTAAGLVPLALLWVLFSQGMVCKDTTYLAIPFLATFLLFLGYFARLKEVEIIEPSIWLLIYDAVYLGLAYVQKTEVTLTYGELMAIGMLLLTFWYDTMGRLGQELLLSHDRTYVPARRIQGATVRWLLTGSTFVTVSGAFLILLGRGAWIVTAIENAILAFLRWLFSGMDYGEESGITQTQPIGGGQPSFKDIFPEEKKNPYLQAFWHSLMTLMIVLMTALIVYLIIRLLLLFYKRFQETSRIREKDKVEYLRPEEKVEVSKREKTERLRFTDRSASAKIRRRYKKWIQKSPGARDLDRRMTPRELEAAAWKTTGDNMEEIHDLYEQARYGKTEISADQVQRMEKAIRNA